MKTNDFNFITFRKYQILALKRAYHFNESHSKHLRCVIKHKAYFREAIDQNSLDEMRSIPT